MRRMQPTSATGDDIGGSLFLCVTPGVYAVVDRLSCHDVQDRDRGGEDAAAAVRRRYHVEVVIDRSLT
jgi:hypothetical protein